MVSAKIFKFSFRLFFFKKGLNILFDYIQERKQPFLDYKDNIIKKSKSWYFFKGVNPWFWSKFSNFLSGWFFFQKGLKIPFDYLQKRKQPFLVYKNDITRKSKNLAFFQRG